MTVKLSVILFLTAAVLAGVCAGEGFAADKPNVLFIILDTLRADHLGCYGYRIAKTPNIDNLAAQGTRFENVISQVPLTFPSHCSIFTSTYPQFHRARDNGSFRLKDDYVTLAEMMKDKGYTTAAFVSTIVLDSKYNLDQGFDVYDDEMEKVKGKRVLKFMDEERTADKITERTVKWLKENKDKRFFLWAHYYDPHTVYDPPPPYKGMFRNPYDGEIAFADEQIGILLNALKELRLDKNTLIIFASDHGESLGEHGEKGHAVFIYEATIKVPLIFVYPGRIPQGKVIEDDVCLLDVMPTILDFTGIKKNKDMQGISLIKQITRNAKVPNLPAYSESFFAKYRFNWSALQAYREGDWKYIKSTGPELYNLKDDPRELTNLIDEKSDLAKKMDKKLEKFLSKTSAPQEKEEKIEIDEETRQKLMSLGYISGSVEDDSARPVPIEMIQIMEKTNLADRLANKGLLDEAIKEYLEVLKVDSKNMEANLHLAQCYKEQQKYEDAMKYFRKAASIKPNEAETHDGLGNIFKTMGLVDKAFEEFQVALLLDPESPGIMNNIGWCYQQKLQIDKALEMYQKVLEIDNTIATTHANMAICYRVKGQLDKALEEIKIALEFDPELAFAHSELCASIATKGDIDAAIPHCEKSIELDPNAFDGYINLGACLERKGQYDKAIENYKKALEIAPWNALAHTNIGSSYIQIKDFDKAVQHLNKALQLNPQNQRAQRMLESIPQQKKK